MIRQRQRAIGVALFAGDMAALTAAFVAAHAVRFHLLAPWLGPIYDLGVHLPLLAVALPAWAVCFQLAGLYRTPSPRLSLAETGAVIRAASFGTLGLALGVLVFKQTLVSRVAVAIFVLAAVPAVVIVRALVRHATTNGHSRRQVAVFGPIEESRRAASILVAHQEWGFGLVGFVTDGSWDHTQAAGLPAPFLGGDADLGRILNAHVIDELLILPPRGGTERVNRVLARCREDGVVARVALADLVPAGRQVALGDFGGVPLVTFSAAPADELMLGIRRLLDVVIAVAALLVASPVFAAIALGLKLTSPKGPVIYKQLRAGLRGRQFWMLKFRSMVPEAESLRPALEPFNEMDGPAFKMSADPRVTRFGAFLRRTSLDEIPQFWNVLRGEMSWVGPRPVPVEEADRYEPWQRRRLSMKPGCTCLWQINGRNTLTFEEWMRLDLQYIDNWSLWLDAKILLLTVPAILRGKGAR